MRPRRRTLSLAAAAMAWALARPATGAGQAPSELMLSRSDRVLVLAPHPDDETLGTGGVLQRAVRLGAAVRVVFLTNGDANEWSFTVYRRHPVLRRRAVEEMGQLRRGEALAAAGILGVDESRYVFLGYPDLGMMRIFTSHWGRTPPLRSEFTRVTAVPYPQAYRPGAAYRGEEVLDDLRRLIADFRPTKVFVSHPADENSDHRALYLFTQVALWGLAPRLSPAVFPCPVHFRRWPMPRGYHPELPLPPPATGEKNVRWTLSPLDPGEEEKKYAAIQAHHTQFLYSGKYMASFARSDEVFGDYPAVSLKPPRSPKLLTPRKEGMPRPFGEPVGEERGAFVGLEHRVVSVEDGCLVQSISYTRSLARQARVSLYVFGWRRDVPFGRMPKLHIQVRRGSHLVFDGDKLIEAPGIRVERMPLRVVVRIPLQVLGSPERIMTSARSTIAEIPLDSVAWRVLQL